MTPNPSLERWASDSRRWTPKYTNLASHRDVGESLYKFLPPDRLPVLRSRLLRFTPPEEFNDPFDIAPVALYREPSSKPTAGRSETPLGDVAARFRGLMQRQLDAMVNRTFLNQTLAANSRGVLCLTESCTSLLMWAHYGASHKGFAIGLDRRHPWLSTARPVIYGSERPTVQVSLDPAMQGVDREDYLYGKSDEWAYEREWRLIRPLLPRNKSVVAGLVQGLSSPDRDPGGPPSLEATLFRVPYDAITSVVIGARMSRRDRTLLAQHLAEQTRFRIRIFECELDAHLFRLRLREVRRRSFLKQYLNPSNPARAATDA